MPVFFSRLVSPRPTFAFDMTEPGREAMERHAEHWQEQARRGIAIAFGPVFDPKGAFGTAIAGTGSEDELRALWNPDPAIAADPGFSFEIHPMSSLILREAQARPAEPTF